MDELTKLSVEYEKLRNLRLRNSEKLHAWNAALFKFIEKKENLLKVLSMGKPGENIMGYPARELIRDSKFRNDIDVIKAGLKSDLLAVSAASEELRGDLKFMTWAVKYTKGVAYQYIAFELGTNAELALLALHTFIENEAEDEIPLYFRNSLSAIRR